MRDIKACHLTRRTSSFVPWVGTVLNHARNHRRGILVVHTFLPNLLQDGYHEEGGEEEFDPEHDECWEDMDTLLRMWFVCICSLQA